VIDGENEGENCDTVMHAGWGEPGGTVNMMRLAYCSLSSWFTQSFSQILSSIVVLVPFGLLSLILNSELDWT